MSREIPWLHKQTVFTLESLSEAIEGALTLAAKVPTIGPRLPLIPPAIITLSMSDSVRSMQPQDRVRQALAIDYWLYCKYICIDGKETVKGSAQTFINFVRSRLLWRDHDVIWEGSCGVCGLKILGILNFMWRMPCPNFKKKKGTLTRCETNCAELQTLYPDIVIGDLVKEVTTVGFAEGIVQGIITGPSSKRDSQAPENDRKTKRGKTSSAEEPPTASVQDPSPGSHPNVRTRTRSESPVLHAYDVSKFPSRRLGQGDGKVDLTSPTSYTEQKPLRPHNKAAGETAPAAAKAKSEKDRQEPNRALQERNRVEAWENASNIISSLSLTDFVSEESQRAMIIRIPECNRFALGVKKFDVIPQIVIPPDNVGPAGSGLVGYIGGSGHGVYIGGSGLGSGYTDEELSQLGRALPPHPLLPAQVCIAQRGEEYVAVISSALARRMLSPDCEYYKSELFPDSSAIRHNTSKLAEDIRHEYGFMNVSIPKPGSGSIGDYISAVIAATTASAFASGELRAVEKWQSLYRSMRGILKIRETGTDLNTEQILYLLSKAGQQALAKCGRGYRSDSYVRKSVSFRKFQSFGDAYTWVDSSFTYDLVCVVEVGGTYWVKIPEYMIEYMYRNYEECRFVVGGHITSYTRERYNTTGHAIPRGLWCTSRPDLVPPAASTVILASIASIEQRRSMATDETAERKEESEDDEEEGEEEDVEEGEKKAADAKRAADTKRAADAIRAAAEKRTADTKRAAANSKEAAGGLGDWRGNWIASDGTSWTSHGPNIASRPILHTSLDRNATWVDYFWDMVRVDKLKAKKAKKAKKAAAKEAADKAAADEAAEKALNTAAKRKRNAAAKRKRNAAAKQQPKAASAKRHGQMTEAVVQHESGRDRESSMKNESETPDAIVQHKSGSDDESSDEDMPVSPASSQDPVSYDDHAAQL